MRPRSNSEGSFLTRWLIDPVKRFTRGKDPPPSYEECYPSERHISRRRRPSPCPSPSPNAQPEQHLTTENDDDKTCFITNIRVNISGDKLDQFGPDDKPQDGTFSFIRTQMSWDSYLNSPFDSNLSLKDWMNGYSIYGFDLTSNQKCNQPHLYPQLRTGLLEVVVDFSDTLGEEIVMITMQEYPTSIYIKKIEGNKTVITREFIADIV
jgi:hypothetical protein